MPALINWLLRLIPTNPIVMRLVHVGSRQMRHLYIRSGYLAVLIVVLLYVLIGPGQSSSLSLRELASAGANMFQGVSFLQIGLICLLTPVFMAGAIAQEANPKTWEIMLTTPLNNLQIVLGNLFGRLFFVLALLLSSLPLFVMIQYFGGVRGESIIVSYVVSGASALLVAAIAVTLSVTRTAGKRAVFIFYISVVMYLFVTAALDQLFSEQRPGSVTAHLTSIMTPLNPFLALRSMLDSNAYTPKTREYFDTQPGWLVLTWMSRPVAVYSWLCFGLSFIMIAFSTLRLRVIGAKVGSVPWYRKMFGLGAKGATEREARVVGHNPIVWRESVARGRTLAAMLGRWGFMTLGILIGLLVLVLFHVGQLSGPDFQVTMIAVLAAEVVIIVLAALNMSATAVSREREDGSLDIILTTPIQPGPYLRGKLVGLMQYLIPMMIVPVVTLGLAAGYIMLGGLGNDEVSQAVVLPGGGTISVPVVLPEGAIALPLLLVPFVAFCVMVGLHWSIKSKGTIGSVIAAVGILVVVLGVVSLCGNVSSKQMGAPGVVIASASPVNLVMLIANPDDTNGGMFRALRQSQQGGRMALLIGAAIFAVVYSAISAGMHAGMKKSFMMTVRRLAGTR
ncbi:MAG: ABC transporter permease subunit [Phycisphaerales bacterium]